MIVTTIPVFRMSHNIRNFISTPLIGGKSTMTSCIRIQKALCSGICYRKISSAIVGIVPIVCAATPLGDAGITGMVVTIIKSPCRINTCSIANRFIAPVCC